MIIFESLLMTFEDKVIFWGSWDGSKNDVPQKLDLRLSLSKSVKRFEHMSSKFSGTT